MALGAVPGRIEGGLLEQLFASNSEQTVLLAGLALRQRDALVRLQTNTKRAAQLVELYSIQTLYPGVAPVDLMSRVAQVEVLEETVR
jgi:hypothetical protein